MLAPVVKREAVAYRQKLRSGEVNSGPEAARRPGRETHDVAVVVPAPGVSSRSANLTTS